jgi:hypothetical protein
LILPPLVLPPLFALVILGAAPDGPSAPVFLLAAERTAQVEAASIARIGEEIDAAMPATAQAFARVRLGPQSRSQEHVILQNQRLNVFLVVPSRQELEKLRDPYFKKAKLSLTMLTR